MAGEHFVMDTAAGVPAPLADADALSATGTAVPASAAMATQNATVRNLM